MRYLTLHGTRAEGANGRGVQRLTLKIVTDLEEVTEVDLGDGAAHAYLQATPNRRIRFERMFTTTLHLTGEADPLDDQPIQPNQDAMVAEPTPPSDTRTYDIADFPDCANQAYVEAFPFGSIRSVYSCGDLDAAALYGQAQAASDQQAQQHLAQRTGDTLATFARSVIGGEWERTPDPAPMLINTSDEGSQTQAINRLNIWKKRFVRARLRDGAEILAEEFQIHRFRPIQVRIPTPSWAYDGAGTYHASARYQLPAPPLASLYYWNRRNPEATQTLYIDTRYNDRGVYQKGHLFPSASGSPYNSFFMVPMHEAVNQSGPWRQLEALAFRMLQDRRRWDDDEYDLSTWSPAALPSLQRLIGQMTYAVSALNGQQLTVAQRALRDRWRSYILITIAYPSEENPIPSRFDATLHRTADRRRFFSFPTVHHTAQAINQLAQTHVASPAMQAAFAYLIQELQRRDTENAKLDQGVRIEGGWFLAHDLVGQNRLPARGAPEGHVPRPYRCLDLIYLGDEVLNAFYDHLGPFDRDLIDKVYGVNPARGREFSAAQRTLAEMFNRYVNGGQFLSDLRAAALPQNLPASIRAMYTDPVGNNPIGPSMGHYQAQGDHHVPKSTGVGFNLFSNFLYVSRRQNLQNAQNKPYAVTNPIRSGTDLNTYQAPARRPAKESNDPTATQELFIGLTTQNGVTGLSYEEVVEAYAASHWAPESYEEPAEVVRTAALTLTDLMRGQGRNFPW